MDTQFWTNCKLPVEILDKYIKDSQSKTWCFHKECFIDVCTGWSGSPAFCLSGESLRK